MDLNKMTQEQRERALASESLDEAEKLTLDELESASGGRNQDGFYQCPKCRCLTIWKVDGGKFQCRGCYYVGNPSEF